jgi:dihydrofolate reductase
VAFPVLRRRDGRGHRLGDGHAARLPPGSQAVREWSEYWPANTDEDGFGFYINHLEKYVVTHRPLEGDVWNSARAITEDHVAAVQAVKEATEGDIGMSGCATTVRWLIANGLLDEPALLVHPIAVAKGQRLFEDTGTVPLKLEHSSTLSSGVMHLRYSPA